MKKQLLFLCLVFAVGMALFQSCKKDATSTEPPQVGVFFSIVDKQVAFTALTLRATSWTWDFGDGTNSTEKNPVHIYKDGGYYDVKLIGANARGDTASAKTTCAVALTPYVLMTGGPTRAKGKTWKIASGHSSKDKFANADASFSTVAALSAGVLGTALGMGEVYDDTYTFHFDGKYEHDVKVDGAAFAGLVFASVTNPSGILNMGGKAYGLCTCKYTPQTGATFTYVENEDFKVPSVYGAGGVITYAGVSTLNFSGTEFVGFMDFQRKVIVQEVTDNTMRLVMFAALSASNVPKNSHALIITFEVVK